MEEINYFMVEEKTESAPAGRGKQPREIGFSWRQRAVTLHLLPAAWFESAAAREEGGKDGAPSIRDRRKKQVGKKALAGKIARYVDSRRKDPDTVWISSALESYLPAYRPPFPSPSLAACVWKEQPFREILILWAEESFWSEKERWHEAFLEDCFADLNGLFLVGKRQEGEEEFWEELYEESGLSACFTQTLPHTDGRKTAVLDLCVQRRPPLRELAPASLYLDLTSDSEKQRLLREMRPDISYQSVRNYLDTAFKARYNAI